ncbi:MAG: hisA/hisF family protein [Planctomycetia bacterium]|nr:hisA/hisF family protein [Planctomycetia bacterium]
MRIIPVVDLMGGVVVRGIAGRRSEYRPILSRLCPSAVPAEVARALAETFDLPELYVADLDAIAGGQPAWRVYEELAACGAQLLVDAGCANVGRARAMSDFQPCGQPLSGVIAGLESIPSPEALAVMVAAVGRERLVFSLDLKDGRPLAAAGAWRDCRADEIAQGAYDTGIRRMIVLDLADVGTGGGVGPLELCRRLRDRLPDCELVAGGGIRGRADLEALAAAGCDAALVASALHDGRLTPQDIAALTSVAGPPG